MMAAGDPPALQRTSHPPSMSADMTPHAASWPLPNGQIVQIPAASRLPARSLSVSSGAAYQQLRRASASSSAMVSFEDYERLPASIKRKFFTPTERLHIAQQPTMKLRRRKLSLGQTHPSSPMYDDDVRPSTSGGISHRHSRRPSKDSNPVSIGSSTKDITEEQAYWYLSLPDKIKKQQFTRREQVTFALQCKRVLESSAPDFAHDALRRCLNLSREQDLTPPLPAKANVRRPSAATINTDILDTEYDQSDLADLRSDSLVGDTEAIAMYANSVLRPSKSMVDISLPPSSSPPPVMDGNSESMSLRRKSHSHLTPLPLPPPQLAPVPPLPPFPPAFAISRFAAAPGSTHSQHTAPNAAPVEPQPESKPPQQSDVRKQLRLWLSPEKFDEALEYGFSFPQDETPPFCPPKSQSPPHQPPPLYHTDDDYSEEDSSDSMETIGPMTPTNVPEPLYPSIKKPSIDSSGDISFRSNPFSLWKGSRKHGPIESAPEREMTVRITLTRRDHREPGEALYGASRPQTTGIVDVQRVDPLALEAITVCDDPTGAHGAFAVNNASGPRGLKKVWKVLRRH